MVDEGRWKGSTADAGAEDGVGVRDDDVVVGWVLGMLLAGEVWACEGRVVELVVVGGAEFNA